MAFRKRNVALRTQTAPPSDEATVITEPSHLPGTRPSLAAATSVTSTGTAELDALLGGHGGLALGSSLLIGEHGTTDYAGALLRAYVTEGLCHGHEIHVVGVGKGWTQNLPGRAVDSKTARGQEISHTAEDKMKIAWRYEKIGRAGEKVTPMRQQLVGQEAPSSTSPAEEPFCHTFDLTRRFEHKPSHQIQYLNPSTTAKVFDNIIDSLKTTLSACSMTSVHRIALPLLLSPALYPPEACQPENVLRFVHAIRALLKQYAGRTTAMLSIPLSLFPRTSGLTRMIEHLCDGIVELVPFPYIAGAALPDAAGKKDTAQGMLQVLKLPLTTERGEGGAGGGNTIGDDLAFTLSRKRFVIEPFSLPPMEGDQEAQSEAGKITAKDVEF